MEQFYSTICAEKWFYQQKGSQHTFSCIIYGKRVTLTSFGTLGMIDIDNDNCRYVHLTD